MSNTKKTIGDFKNKYRLRDEYISRPEPTDDEIVKALEQKNTIPFISGLEDFGLSIVEIQPIYFQDDGGYRSRLRNLNCVTTAKELEKRFIPNENSPSIIHLLGNNYSNVGGHIRIHSCGPDSKEDYNVFAFRTEYNVGLKNVPVCHLVPKNLMNYLKTKNI